MNWIGRAKESTAHLCCLVLCATVLAPTLIAEEGKLSVHVSDPESRDVAGISIGVSGLGGSPKPTGPDGRALLLLAPETKENSWIDIHITESPAHHDFVMLSPWNNRTLVPSFKNDSGSYIEIVVAERLDKAILAGGRTLVPLINKINKANEDRTIQDRGLSPHENLEAVAKEYGLAPEEIDRAVRKPSDESRDPNALGVAALYKRDFPEAIRQLTISRDLKKDKLQADIKAFLDDCWFLGSAYFEEGAYTQAADTFASALAFRPNDPALLNNTGLAFMNAGKYAQAERLLERGFDLCEIPSGCTDADAASALSSLAALNAAQGKFARAYSLLQRALAIDKRVFGPSHVNVANDLNNMAAALENQGMYTEAETRYREAHRMALAVLEPVS